MCVLTYRYYIEQERTIAERRYPASSTRQDVENHVKQSPVCATGTPSLLRQPSPLKELWVRSQMADLGQQSPAISTIPSPSPLKMQLFGILHSLPNIPAISPYRHIAIPTFFEPSLHSFSTKSFRVATSPKSPADAEVLALINCNSRVRFYLIMIMNFDSLNFSSNGVQLSAEAFNTRLSS